MRLRGAQLRIDIVGISPERGARLGARERVVEARDKGDGSRGQGGRGGGAVGVVLDHP